MSEINAVLLLVQEPAGISTSLVTVLLALNLDLVKLVSSVVMVDYTLISLLTISSDLIRKLSLKFSLTIATLPVFNLEMILSFKLSIVIIAMTQLVQGAENKTHGSFKNIKEIILIQISLKFHNVALF